MEQNKSGGLVIQDRPQISVVEADGLITISTASISDDFERVEHHDVVIPVECGEAVAKAILAIVRP